MCTAILSIEPGAPPLLAGVRDEFVDRPWRPPGRHWPDDPGLLGGVDLLAGGTWLAVAPAARRVACVLNGRGRQADPAGRQSRGVLPLQAARHGRLALARPAAFDPFHLLSVEPGRALMWSWDGDDLTHRELAPGLHMVVNTGIVSEAAAGGARAPGGRGQAPGGPTPADGSPPPGGPRPADPREQARIAHFLPLLRAAARPAPRPGPPVAEAWGAWLPLLSGAGIPPTDRRALIVRRTGPAGQAWGTTSVSLVALSADGVRYDFADVHDGDLAWRPVPV
jgi:transport and Golgi organization protein 2